MGFFYVNRSLNLSLRGVATNIDRLGLGQHQVNLWGSWHWFYWTWRKLPQASHRIYPCSVPATKTSSHKHNTTGYIGYIHATTFCFFPANILVHKFRWIYEVLILRCLYKSTLREWFFLHNHPCVLQDRGFKFHQDSFNWAASWTAGHKCNSTHWCSLKPLWGGLISCISLPILLYH